MALLSIVVITYNQEDTITNTLESIFNQKINIDFELIISNDASTDNTLNSIQKCIMYAPNHIKIKLINREKNIGATANFFKTIYEATGRYVALCEGDDYWIDNNKLQKQIHFLENNLDVKYVFTSAIIKLKNDEKVKSYKINSILKLEDLFEKEIMPITSTVMFYRDVLPKSLPNFALNAFNADWILFVLIGSINKLGYMNDITSLYRCGIGILYYTEPIYKLTNGINTNIQLNLYTKNKYRKYLLNFSKHYENLSYVYISEKKINSSFKYAIKKIYNDIIYRKTFGEFYLYFKSYLKLLIITFLLFPKK